MKKTDVSAKPLLDSARNVFHKALLGTVLTVDKAGVPSIADTGNASSKAISISLINKLGEPTSSIKAAGQTAGGKFEVCCLAFLDSTFRSLSHLRPGRWLIEQLGQRDRVAISSFEQYAHLADLSRLISENKALSSIVGMDYLITPDIVIVRKPEPDSVINKPAGIVADQTARLTPLRELNHGLPSMHACISCKWTLRSDRAQNARSEALSLIRLRKGRVPHIAVVTAEPLPSRLASLALGTGDIDCVYHFALNELTASIKELKLHDAEDLLLTMIEGKRLRDISDLPLDLAI